MEEKIKPIVWLNEQERIASFHSGDGYVRRDFASRALFLRFLESLVECGYRFQ